MASHVHEGGTYETTTEVLAVIQATRERVSYQGGAFILRWSNRTTNAMGIAKRKAGRDEIILSVKHWKVATPEKRRATIVHEVCHFAAGFQAGHGPVWKRMMLLCGEAPERCHTVNYTEAHVQVGACTRCQSPIRVTRRQAQNLLLKVKVYGKAYFHRCARGARAPIVFSIGA